MGEFKLQEQSNRIQRLLDKADEQGYVTLDQTLEVFPDAEEDLVQLEDLFAYLYDQGVEVYESEEETEDEKGKVEEAPGGNGDGNGHFDLSDIAPDERKASRRMVYLCRSTTYRARPKTTIRGKCSQK